MAKIIDTPLKNYWSVSNENPEIIMAEYIREFFHNIEYEKNFKNFSGLRIDLVHPFILMHFEESEGKEPTLTNRFPSITVSDTATSEDITFTGMDETDFMIDEEDFKRLETFWNSKKMIISQSGLKSLKSKLKSDKKIHALKRRFTSKHSFNFNIWTENRDLTSNLFGILFNFLAAHKTTIYEDILINVRPPTGTRASDVNFDFGRILYGGTINCEGIVIHEEAIFDDNIPAEIKNVKEVDNPQYKR